MAWRVLTTLGAIKQGTAAAAAAGTSLLTSVAYNPGTLTTVTTTSTTPADLDTTNLVVTFTAPASGRVLVGLGALANLSAGATGYIWLLRDTGGTDITNSRCQVCGASTTLVRPQFRVIISGLTPGATITWRWAHAITAAAATGNTFYGDAGSTNPRGPAVMEVWSA